MSLDEQNLVINNIENNINTISPQIDIKNQVDEILKLQLKENKHIELIQEKNGSTSLYLNMTNFSNNAKI